MTQFFSEKRGVLFCQNMSEEHHGSDYYLKETARSLVRFLKAVRDEMGNGDQEDAPVAPAVTETPKKAKSTKRAQPAAAAAAPATAATDTQWNECQCSKFRNGEACPRDPDVAGYFVPNKSLTIVAGPSGTGKKVQLSQKCAAEYAKIRPKRPKNPNGKKVGAADGETPAKKKKGVAPAPAAQSRNNNDEEEEEEVEQFADDAEEGQVEHEEEVDV